MVEIVTIIPARGGSKSIPGKNIKLLGSHPLIAYSIIASKLCKRVSRTIVSTDSPEIAAIAEEYGALVPFLRPKEFSRDDSPDIELFRHYLDFLHNNSMTVPDLIVHLRPTTPLREVRVIDEAVKYMMEHPQATALRSMYKTNLTPYKMFKRKGEYAKPFLSYKKCKEFYNLPRQTFEDTYVPNGYVDIIRPSILQKTGQLHGEKIKLWETDKVADIDVLEDFDFAGKLLHDKKYGQIIGGLKRGLRKGR